MVADPELPPDDRRHPLGGPDVTAKAERLRPLGQQPRDLRPLLSGQLWDRTRPGPTLQRLDPSLPHAPHPLADRPSRYPECLRNRLLAPPLLFQRPGPQPTPFTPLLWLYTFLCHTPEHRTARSIFSVLHGDQ
jgi:hypothetical protein